MKYEITANGHKFTQKQGKIFEEEKHKNVAGEEERCGRPAQPDDEAAGGDGDDHPIPSLINVDISTI